MRGGAVQSVSDGVFAEQPLVPQAAVLQLARHGIGVIGVVLTSGEMPQRRTVLRAQHQDHVRITGGDRRGELGHHMLGPLSPNGFEHRPGRRGPDAVAHRTRIVRRTPQRRGAPAGDLELPDAHHGIDRLRDGVDVGAGVGQSGRGRRRREVHRRHAPVRRVVDPFGELPDPDDDRRPRIDRRHRPRTLCVTGSSGSPGPIRR